MTGLKNFVLIAFAAGMLLTSGGCMCLPHPGHGGDEKGHAHAATPEGSAQPAEAERADLSKAKAVNNQTAIFASHHGLGEPHNPWTWLAGAGMVAMMLLMIL